MPSPFHNHPKKFLSSIEASRLFSVTNDYVSLLCRQGKVAGERRGRQWFVDGDALETYLREMRLLKAERSKKLSNQLRSEYAKTGTSATGAVPATTTIAGVPLWVNTFAPKRTAWYTPLAETEINLKHFVTIVMAVNLFFAAIVLSPQVFPSSGVSLEYNGPSVVAEVPVPQSNGLLATTAYAEQVLHMPSDYVDTSDVPPAIVAPTMPISADDMRALTQASPYFVNALKATTLEAWNNSFEKEANIFVASVYEMGGNSNNTVNVELNVGLAWNAWTSALSQTLYQQ